MTHDDFDELLQQLDPARDTRVPSPDSVRGESIRARALRHRQRPRRLLVAVAAAVLVTGATAGAMVLWSAEPEFVAVTCYAAADLDSTRIDGDRRLGLGPEACAPLWQGGAFGDGPPPPLVACVVDDIVGVFPGPEDTCDLLGLPRSAGAPTALATLAELDAALREALNRTPCVTAEDAVPAATQVVADLGLRENGWVVRLTTQTTPERRCASFSIDQEGKFVAITPIP